MHEKKHNLYYPFFYLNRLSNDKNLNRKIQQVTSILTKNGSKLKKKQPSSNLDIWRVYSTER